MIQWWFGFPATSREADSSRPGQKLNSGSALSLRMDGRKVEKMAGVATAWSIWGSLVMETHRITGMQFDIRQGLGNDKS